MSDNNQNYSSSKNVWIFDLDNTLYPADSYLFPQMDLRMGGFIADLMGVEYDEAKVIQKGYFVKYGTTLNGLMANHDVDPEHFLDYVHDVDLSPIAPKQSLTDKIAKLNGKKLVFTNGSFGHGERILKHLEMDHLFDGIFGVGQSGYIPKPDQKAYDSFVEHFDFDTSKAVMIDDMARNLTPAHKMGIKTVWLQTDSQWANIDYNKDHVDHEISCLESWLESVLGDKS